MVLHQKIKFALFTMFVLVSNVNAEIVLDGTRKVYPADNREVTLQLSNVGKTPALIQAWIDEGDPNTKPNQSQAPFMITPPVARIEADKGQALRIMALPAAAKLSQDKETLFWLNVLDIPPKPDGKTGASPENYLQLAVRSRIKFIYRPESLKAQANKAAEKLEWKKVGNSLSVKNPTPYFITVSGIVNNKEQDSNLLSYGFMLEPFAESEVKISSQKISDNMTYTTINDLGARIKNTLKIK